MPRLKNDTDILVRDLVARLEKLVATARREGRESALAEVRSLVAGGGKQGGGSDKPARRKRRAAKRKRKSSKPRKNPWLGLTPRQRLKRINAMRKGRGLPLKKSL